MRFMLTFTWKQPPNEEVAAVFPKERERGKELIEQGISEPAVAAADGSTFWAIWNCDSMDKALEIAETLPLYPYVNIDFKELSEDKYD